MQLEVNKQNQIELDITQGYNVYDNTKLYAVKYPENKSQESGEITYIANEEVLKILKKEKKEGESRTALEERLMQKQ